MKAQKECGCYGQWTGGQYFGSICGDHLSEAFALPNSIIPINHIAHHMVDDADMISVSHWGLHPC